MPPTGDQGRGVQAAVRRVSHGHHARRLRRGDRDSGRGRAGNHGRTNALHQYPSLGGAQADGRTEDDGTTLEQATSPAWCREPGDGCADTAWPKARATGSGGGGAGEDGEILASATGLPLMMRWRRVAVPTFRSAQAARRVRGAFNRALATATVVDGSGQGCRANRSVRAGCRAAERYGCDTDRTTRWSNAPGGDELVDQLRATRGGATRRRGYRDVESRAAAAAPVGPIARHACAVR